MTHNYLMRHLAVLPCLAILAGCQFSENRYLTRPVKPGEVVGTWRATEYAVKSLREVGVREHLTVQEHKLVLRPDGTCSIQTVMNMPVFPQFPGDAAHDQQQPASVAADAWIERAVQGAG